MWQKSENQHREYKIHEINETTSLSMKLARYSALESITYSLFNRFTSQRGSTLARVVTVECSPALYAIQPFHNTAITVRPTTWRPHVVGWLRMQCYRLFH